MLDLAGCGVKVKFNEVVSKNAERHLARDLGHGLGQEVRRPHPHLEGGEWMLKLCGHEGAELHTGRPAGGSIRVVPRDVNPHFPYGLPFPAMLRRDNLFDAIG